ncbi:MAG: ABC transporter ATP-binding protein, partial [Clostridia bacterium]|nr:ABC transporter ATP-binding protein [Clostridia bacterium]
MKLSETKANNHVTDIRNLFVEYKTYAGMVKVLNGVNFYVDSGEKVAIVGETGCGKTTTVKSILRILADNSRISGGEIFFKGKDVLKMKDAEVKRLRGSGISMIFQDP